MPPFQPYLNFLDLPAPETSQWGQLTDPQKTVVIELLARLLVKAARTSQPNPENEHD